MEFFDIIDEKGNELGFRKERTIVHKDGYWHKGVHVWIIKGNKVLLQKRAPQKDSFPNCLDVGCGGHVTSGSSYDETAIKELKEELGIVVSKKDLIFLENREHITRDPPRRFINKEIINVYVLNFKGELGDLTLQRDEVSKVKLFSIEELRTLLNKKPSLFTPNISYSILDKLEKILWK
jgi:8-oxo-dGTP diphosphatase